LAEHGLTYEKLEKVVHMMVLQQQQQQQQLQNAAATTMQLAANSGTQRKVPAGLQQKAGPILKSVPIETVKKVSPTDMKNEITKLLTEMGKNGNWMVEGVFGQATVMDVGFNPDLQGSANSYAGLQSVGVDNEFKDIMDSEEDDMAFILGSDYATPSWKIVSPLAVVGDKGGTMSIEDEVQEIETKFNMKGQVLAMAGSSTVTVTFKNNLDSLIDKVIFVITERGLYEQRTGDSGEGMKEDDELMDVSVECLEREYSYVNTGSLSRRMQDVISSL
ncbi:hypothetical protein HDU99_008314, partial [Rhizoclosmatium hyalinum]